MSAPYDYDIVIIGGGSGGLACSKECAKFGARVAVLDFVKPSPAGTTWGLGGTCVNVGCIPKKLMHTAGLLGESVHDAESYGWAVSKGALDWNKLVDAVQDYIASLNFAYRVELKDKSVTYINALGSFVDAHTLECADKKGKRTRITSQYFVIAVGGRPRSLGIPGQEHAISSDDIFSLPQAPGKTLCIGASYVSLECAGFIRALGMEAHVMVRSILLRGFDQEAAGIIEADMARKGVQFIKSTVPVSITKKADGKLVVKFRNVESGVEAEDEFDTVLSAIGRDADLSGLALPAVGVVVGPDGKLKCVNEQTNVPHVFAIGDVISKAPELTPVAIKAGRLLAARLFGGSSALMDYKMVPTTVFTPLEYGSVGYAEEEAKEVFGKDRLEIFVSSFSPLEWKLTPHRASQSAFAKLICDKENDLRVIGFHILGPNAGEITQGFAVAVKMGATYAQFSDTVGIHPTTAEEFTTLMVTKASGESAEKGGC